jgi:hypothetical protein
MSISRHNYEELFLLYVDNELTKAERLDVENFVRSNEDLARELNALKESVLKPGNEELLDKTNLYKQAEGITPANCETYFLLHVDDELTGAEKYAVETFVLQHPESQANFSLLHQTKLETEPVVFQNKELLYKKDERKLVWMNWSRIAIAAMFVGVSISLYFIIPSNHVQQLQADVKQPVNATNTVNLPPVATINGTVNKSSSALIPNTSSTTVVNGATKSPLTSTKNSRSAKQPAIKKIESNRQDNASIATLDRPHPVDVSISEKITLPVDNNLAAEITPQLASNKIITVKKQLDIEATNLAHQTVYREIDTDADERENSFLFGSTRINKNKLRGLLKKASGLFDKKADKADNGKTIQIASFEIKGK